MGETHIIVSEILEDAGESIRQRVRSRYHKSPEREAHIKMQGSIRKHATACVASHHRKKAPVYGLGFVLSISAAREGVGTTGCSLLQPNERFRPVVPP